MPAPRIVFGRGLPALIAANALIAAGERVLWLDPGDGPAVEPSLDPAPWRARAVDQHRLEGVLGPLRPATQRQRAVVLDGRVLALPLGRRDRARLLRLTTGPEPIDALLRARARSVIAEAIGGGQEERSYKDWSIRRFGEPLHRMHFARYARRRWGAAAEALSASTAWWHHFVPHDATLVEPVGGVVACAELLLLRFVAAGGERKTGAAIASLGRNGGRIHRMALRDGTELSVDAPPWLQANPHEIAGWLGAGALQPGMDHVARALQSADRLLLELPDPTPTTDQELHLLDDGPFWMLRRTAGRITLVGTANASEPTPTDLTPWIAAATSICGPLHVEGEPRLRRLSGVQPQWRPQTLAWMRDLLVAWDRLGIVSFGRAGTLADLDPAEQARYALLITEGEADQREAHRLIAEPSASEADLLASTGAVITR